ncbi:MAG: hypothetical protein JST93_31850 [Acidobacteria bacterium]|nr:hypothetical protein [Acidobacteriota bacterium]
MPQHSHNDEPPPFLGSWPRVYVLVVMYLMALIVGFYVFCRWVTPK